jgi:hypothetical protein
MTFIDSTMCRNLSFSSLRLPSPLEISAAFNPETLSNLQDSPRHHPPLNESIIRQEAVKRGMSIFTTISGADAAVSAVESLKKKTLEVKSLQEYTGGIA